jgi:hypothetical protein
MTPGEVKSLNDIAMAHGGHLTINPHTGLPEAGFLSSILPMLAGGAITALSGGAINPMTASLLVGGATGAMTGSLSKGLMAGLGAYGGAGLGESLAQSGMQAAAAPELMTAKTQLGALTPDQISAFESAQGPVTSGPVYEAQQAAKQAAEKMAQQQTAYGSAGVGDRLSTLGQGFSTLGTKEGWSNLANNAGGTMGLAKYGLAAAAPVISDAMTPTPRTPTASDKDMGQRYTYSPNKLQGPYTASPTGVEQRYFNPAYTPVSSDQAKSIYGFADGGVATATPMPGEAPSYKYDPMVQLFSKIESMPSDDQAKQSAEEQTRSGNGPPAMTDAQFGAQQAQGEANAKGLGSFGESVSKGIMGLLSQPPIAVQIAQALANAVTSGMSTSSGGVSPSSGSPMGGVASKGTHGQANAAVAAANSAAAAGGRGGMGNVGTGSGGTASGVGTGIGSVGGMGGGLREGGLSDAHFNLGGYSDGGRLLRGPGDGVSDSIPATIGHKQPARLADGEFVVPARIVSELGNGSTEAGARKLYAMMDRVQSARSKTVGKGKIAANSKSEKYLPA